MLPNSQDLKKEKLKDTLLGLHWAATTGNVGLIKFALDHGVPIDSVVNGFVPLQLACISDNNLAAVQYLIDRGADVNLQKWSKKRSVDKIQAVPGATGSTALHVGCANGCVKIVDLLIRNNARIDVKDKYGSTPLDVAQAKHESEIVKILKQAIEKQKQRKNIPQLHHSLDENEGQPTRKSIDATLLTHKRTSSDKEPRIRRPSLPSIFEDHQPLQIPNIPSIMSMTSTLSTTSKSNSLEVPPNSGRSFSSVHRPSLDELKMVHSCPATPRSSLDCINTTKRSHQAYKSRSPRSSEDSSVVALSTTSHLSVSYPADDWSFSSSGQQPDWYGYGVVNPYDDENYLLSLERRAFNTGSNKNGDLERHSQEYTRSSYEGPIHHNRLSSGPHSTSTTIATDEIVQQQDICKHTDLADFGIGGQQLRTTALKNAMAANSAVSLSTNESPSPCSDSEEEYNEEAQQEEEESDQEKTYDSEPLPRPSVALDSGPEADMLRRRILREDEQQRRPRPHSTDQETIHAESKKKWFSGFSKDNGRHSFDSSHHHRKSLDFRPSFDNLTQFAKRGIGNLAAGQNEGEDPSNEHDFSFSPQLQHHKNCGFFSRWAPAWGRK